MKKSFNYSLNNLIFFLILKFFSFIQTLLFYTEHVNSFNSILFLMIFVISNLDLLMYIMQDTNWDSRTFIRFSFIPKFDFYVLQIIKLILFLSLSFFYEIINYELISTYLILCFLYYNTIPDYKKNNYLFGFWENQKLKKEKKDYNKKLLVANYFDNFVLFLLIITLFINSKKNILLFVIFVSINFIVSTRIIKSKKIFDFRDYNLARNRKEFFINEYANFIITTTTWILPIAALLLFKEKNIPNILLFVVIIVYSLIQDFFILNEYSGFDFKGLLPGIFKILLITSLYIVYILETKNLIVTPKQLAEFIIPIVSAVFIFNFSATIYLLQEDYHKYESVYLLKRVLNFPSIFFTIIVPVFTVVITLLGVITNYQVLWSVFVIEYCITSSCYILFMFRYYLDTRKTIMYLLSKTDKYIIADYRESAFIDTENEIDIVKKILKKSFNESQSTTFEDCNKTIFNWIINNIDDIYTDNDYIPMKERNNFLIFFDEINQSISNGTPLSVRKNYVEFVGNLYRNISIKELNKYELFIQTLKKLIEYEIYNQFFKSDEVIILSINYMKYKIFDFINEIEIKDKDELLYIKSNEDYSKFDDIIIQNLRQSLQVICECEDITLKNKILTSIYFSQHCNFSNSDQLTEVHLEYYGKLFELINYLVENNKYNQEIIKHFIYEYRYMGLLFHKMKLNTKIKEYFFNVYQNNLTWFYKLIIKNEYHLKEFDYQCFYEPCFEKNCDVKQLKTFLDDFEFFISLDNTVKDNYSEEEKNNFFRIWNRVEQLRTILKKNNSPMINYWENIVSNLSYKYKIILAEYDFFVENQKKEWNLIKQVIEERY